jgi:hypothetical protein
MPEQRTFQSLGEIKANNRGSKPASRWAKELGITTKQVGSLMVRDGKHLTGCFSRRTVFFAVPGIRAGKIFSKRLFENFKAAARMLIPESKRKFWGVVARCEKYPVTNIIT